MGPFWQYLKSGYVAKLLKINKKTLYRWEAAGKIPQARRHPTNRFRVYTRADVEKIHRVIDKGLK